MIVSVFRDLYKSTDVPFHVPLDKIIKRIKAGTSKELVEAVRNGNIDKKKKLPSILFAGTFTERNSSSLQKHSGLMVVDFDKYPNEKTMFEQLELLKQNPHFVLLFISPSGKGIKGVIKVCDNLTKDTHPKVFKEFYKKFEYEYFDIVNSDICRICFESYDPNIYVNMDAQTFEPILKDEGFTVSERAPLVPITDEDKIIAKIMDWNWQKDFVEGERNSYIFDLAGAFCEYGVSEYNCEMYILNNVVIGEFSEQEAKTTIKSAYKKRNFDTKYFENYEKINSIKVDLKRGKKEVIEKYGITEGTFDEIKEVAEHDDFWCYTDKNKLKIDNLKYKLFLERNGFKKYFQSDAQKASWIYVSSNKVVETSAEKIKDFVLNYLLERNEWDVWNYCASFQNIFSETYLSMIESVELLMLQDSKFKSYIAFENGILEVTKDTTRLVDFIDVDGYVWKSQIIPRDYVHLEQYENEYATFIKNISNSEPLPIECVIGYLLSTYKNKMNNKAIILNDEVISENPEGGTGKGLFVQGLRQIRKVSILDGKTFDDKKSFPYQTVSPETQVLVFDDVKQNFDFESKFSLVTEGMTLERKNKDAIKLKVEESPKLVISTNYAIKGEGNSHDRRRFEIEFAQYYGKALTPYDEFDRQLFDDWELNDFQRFDNYMVYCLQCYLKLGLVPQNAKNIKMRKFIAETSMEFLEWIKDIENVPHNDRLEKSLYYINFTNEYQDFKKWLTNKKFNIWVQKYCNFIGAEYLNGNSNGFRWFTIKTDTNQVDNNDEIFF